MAELLGGLSELARRRDGIVPPAHEARERDRFVGAALAGALPPRRRGRRALALVAAAAALVAIALLAWPARDLRFEVRGSTVSSEGYVAASDRPADILFSDGTTVTLEPGSASRVVEIDDHGARILLERGRAAVSVVPLPGASWAFAAGPYAVRVTGTRFSLAWDPATAIFELSLEEGSVEVRGPPIDGKLDVRGGQELVAKVAEGGVELRELSRPAEPSARAQHSPAPTVATSPATEPSAAAPAAGAPPPSWPELLARGDYQRVLAEAEARGVEAVLASGSADEVMALGEAARYGGDGALARRALLSLRERFAASSAAKTAAFLLGRMAEPSSSAIVWYDRYLAEAPGGAYAAEALGRKLHLASKGDRAAARALAQQYLAAYPKGAYAELARQLAR